MLKAVVCLLVLALCYTFVTASVIRKNCTEYIYEDGETETDCENEVVFRSKNGHLDQYQLFQNDSMVVLKFPNRTGCYIVRMEDLPDGIKDAQFDKMKGAVEADADVAAAIGELVEECKATTVYEMNDAKEENEDADASSLLDKAPSRRKRGCRLYYVCRFYYSYYYWYGTLYRRRRVRCIRWLRCYGK